LGCGLGAELAFLARHGLYAVGIDVSAAVLAKASSDRDRSGAHFIQGDVLHVPFADQTFDALLDGGCFLLVPEAARTAYVDQAARVLRPGGRLLLRASDARALDAVFPHWSVTHRQR